MQICSLLGAGKLLTKIVAGLFRTVADIYGKLLTIVDFFNNSSLAETLGNAIDNIYVLVGVFMMFRLFISLLNYLIDPDKVEDKKIGGGQLISHIIISIVLLISGTFIFEKLNELQYILLDKDGILYNIIETTDTSYNTSTTDDLLKQLKIEEFKTNTTNILIPQVKAATSDCNLSSMSNFNIRTDGCGASNDCLSFSLVDPLIGCNKSDVEAWFKKRAKADFDVETAGKEGFSFVPCSNSVTNYCYSIASSRDTVNTANNKNEENTISEISILNTDTLSNQYLLIYKYIGEGTSGKKFSRECYYGYKEYETISSVENNVEHTEEKVNIKKFAHLKVYSTTGNGGITIKNSDYNSATTKIRVDSTAKRTVSGYTFFPIAISNEVRYSSNVTDTESAIIEKGKCPGSLSNVSCSGTECHTTGTLGLKKYTETDNGELICGSATISEFTACINKIASQNGYLLDGENPTSGGADSYEGEITEAGYTFATKILQSFVTPSTELNEAFLSDPTVTEEWAKKIEDEEPITVGDKQYVYSMDWIMGLIVGVAVIVLMLVIFVEIVIRNLKLVFLQIIAPIAFTSYMNPEDKIFNSWLKQYIGTYIDLFFKLFAVLVVPVFMMKLLESNYLTGIYRIMVVAGSLLFIKLAPDFLSKIFGIENMAGSFKDSFGLVRSGLGFGVGAAVGAIGAGSVLAHGGTLGQALGTAGSGLTGGANWNFSNMGKKKRDYNKAGLERRNSGQTWWDAQKDAFKSGIPFMKTDADKAQAAKGAGDAYKSLDAALTGALYSKDKRYEEMDKLLASGDNTAKINAASSFGVNTNDSKWNSVDEGGKLAMIREAWGREVDTEKGSILFNAQKNVANGTADAFDSNITELSKNVDNSERFTAAGKSGVSSTTSRTDAVSKLSTAKKHNKSGYVSENV